MIKKIKHDGRIRESNAIDKRKNGKRNFSEMENDKKGQLEFGMEKAGKQKMSNGERRGNEKECMVNGNIFFIE